MCLCFSYPLDPSMWDIPFYCGSASLSALSNKCGFGHNYALSTQMAGELLSSQRLQLSPIASVLHLNFSCLSRDQNPSNYRCLSSPQVSGGGTLTVPLCQSAHHQARLDLLPNYVSTLSSTLSPYNLPLLLQQPLLTVLNSSDAACLQSIFFRAVRRMALNGNLIVRLKFSDGLLLPLG